MDVKRCKTEYNRRYYQETHFARRNAYLKLHGPCKNCGSWKNLEFHHRKGEVRHKSWCSVWSWKLSRRLQELTKCDILCKGCHLAADVTLVHGTLSCYVHANCRCILCKEAQNKYTKERWKRNKLNK